MRGECKSVCGGGGRGESAGHVDEYGIYDVRVGVGCSRDRIGHGIIYPESSRAGRERDWAGVELELDWLDRD